MSGYDDVVETVRRDRFGRPLIVPPGGGEPIAYTRATTLAGTIEDTYNLGQWQQRMVAAGLAQRRDLHLRAASLGLQPDDEAEAKAWKRAMNEVTDLAREAALARAAALTGTALHAFTEAVDLGRTDLRIPPEYARHLDNYRRVTEPLTALHIEQFVVVDELQTAGTTDRIVRVEGRDKLYIADTKTGTVKYGVGRMCMQLAIYAHGQRYDPATGARHPLGDVDLDEGLIIHLDAKTGACELLWIDIAAGWEAVQLAVQVKRWRARKDLARTWLQAGVEPPKPKAPTHTQRQRQSLLAAIEAAASPEELVTIWRGADSVGLWTKALTEAAATRKHQLTNPHI